MKRRLPFRGWYYFRMGWSTYFAFIFAAINTLTVTFYLAVERYPVLNTIFPSFLHYVVIIVSIGVPLLIFIGFAHYKRTAAYRSEADVAMEVNPYNRRTLVNTELNILLNVKLVEMLLKLSKNEKISDEDLKEIEKIKTELTSFVESRTFGDTSDLSFLRKMVDK